MCLLWQGRDEQLPHSRAERHSDAGLEKLKFLKKPTRKRVAQFSHKLLRRSPGREGWRIILKKAGGGTSRPDIELRRDCQGAGSCGCGGACCDVSGARIRGHVWPLNRGPLYMSVSAGPKTRGRKTAPYFESLLFPRQRRCSARRFCSLLNQAAGQLCDWRLTPATAQAFCLRLEPNAAQRAWSSFQHSRVAARCACASRPPQCKVFPGAPQGSQRARRFALP